MDASLEVALPATSLRSKDLLGIAELTPEEILLILDTTEAMKEISQRQIKKVPASFDPPGVEAAESPEAASPPGGPAATDADPVAVESEPSAAPEAGTDPDSEAAPRGTGG